ncbi:hypothetical protein [Nocardia neocaledoniensis]|uniref:hypothetical protein n=1 Tax=Nocardia neocaledoniensis TaxID=236511 RepID=UPI00245491B6|nr:hypothetical protein [Nocardia neocaledoniensis]
MTDYVVGPGGTLPDAASSIDAHALLLGDQALLVLAARYRATQIGRDGQLVAADALDAAVLARGGQRLTGLDFSDAITPGWRTVLSTHPDGLVVTDPDGTLVYDGTLGPADVWLAPARTAAAGGHGLPVVICSAASPEDVLEAMASGRAAWVRSDLDVR